MTEQNTRAPIQVRFFGALQVRYQDKTGAWQDVPTETWGSKMHARRLLSFLVFHDRRASRGLLMDQLWPDSASSFLDTYLSQAVSRLRNVLQDETLLQLNSRRTIYQLAEQARVWTDIDAYESAFQEAERVGVTSPEGCLLLEEARSYAGRGWLLEANDDRWCHARRDQVETSLYRLHLWLAEAYEAQDRLREAEKPLEALLQKDALDATALSHLLALLLKQGLITEARRRAKSAALFYKQQGVPFPSELEDLVHHLKRQAGKEPSSPPLLSSPVASATYSQSHHPFIDQQRAMASQTRLPPPLQEPSTAVPAVGVLLSQALTTFEVTAEECASYVGEKQAQVVSWLDQWMGWATRCLDLQTPLYLLLAQVEEIATRMHLEQSRSSRRQMLVMLAALPIASLPLTQVDTPTHFAETFLPRCAASLIACRHLMKGQEFFYVEHVLARMTPGLLTLVEHPSAYQTTAAHLMAQRNILAGILAMHRLHWAERKEACQQAIQMSLLTADRNLQLISHVQLALTFYYTQESPSLAFTQYEEVSSFFQECSPLAQSNFSVKQATSLAQEGHIKEARKALEQAYRLFPSEPEQDTSFLYADFGLLNLYMHEGIALLELARQGGAKPGEAWDAFTRMEQLVPSAITSERTRVETLNYQAKAALVLADLDLFEHTLVKGVQGARQLKSARRLQEAVDNYKQARQHWPQEQRIQDLAELFLT